MKTHRVMVTTFKPNCTHGPVVKCGEYDLPFTYYPVVSFGGCISSRIKDGAEHAMYVLVGSSYYRVGYPQNTISILPEDVASLPKPEPEVVDPAIEGYRLSSAKLQSIRTRAGAQLLSVTEACGILTLWVFDNSANSVAPKNRERAIEMLMANDNPNPEYTRRFISSATVRNVAGGLEVIHAFERLSPLPTQTIYYERTSTCPTK